MTVVSVNGNQASVDVFNASRNASGQASVQCDGDIILNFPTLAAEVLLGNALNGNVSVQYVGGILAPNEEAFNKSNWALSWRSQYLVSGSGTVNFRGNNFNIALDPSTITMDCQTLGSGQSAFQSITVPAGTYQALKVVCQGQGQGTGTVNGGAISGFISAQSTQWFAPYVGLLKMQSDYANFDVFGITIPLGDNGVSGQAVLQSFVKAP